MATSVRDADLAGAPRGEAHRAARQPATDRAVERSLAALVKAQIVPGLVLAHRSDMAPPGLAGSDPVADPFTALVLADDPAPLFAEIDRLLAEGAGVAAVMVDVLAPAARLIGSWWEEERCDFVAVTMGLWRLQEVVHALADRAAPAAERAPCRALFATFPGDRPDFMTTETADQFRRGGWQAERIFPADLTALLAAVAREPADLLVLSVDGAAQAARLPAAITALRSVSAHPRLKVIVAGAAQAAWPGLAAQAGADGAAKNDARETLRVAEALVNSAADCRARG